MMPWQTVSSLLVGLAWPPAPSTSPLAHCLPWLATATLHLLEQRDAIENWDEFAAVNQLSGWNETAPVCEWSGVACDGSLVYLL